MKFRKGQGILSSLGALGIGIAALAIALTVAFLVMGQGKDQIGSIDNLDTDGDGTINNSECIKSIACNSTSSLQVATDTIPGWVPLIIIAAIGGLLLGLVKMFK